MDIFLNSIELFNANRQWLMPIVLAGVIAGLVYQIRRMLSPPSR
jgi:hypothetical protein